MKRQNLNVIDLIQYGVKRTFPGYGIVRMFSPNAWAMNQGRRDLKAPDDGGLPDEYQLLQKFYRKYPEIKYMPVLGPLNVKHGG
jgi:hypothetical protein